MPKQGVTSMFNFGMNFGAWKAFLAIHKIPDFPGSIPQKIAIILNPFIS